MFKHLKFMSALVVILAFMTLTVGASPPMLSKTNKTTLTVAKDFSTLTVLDLNQEFLLTLSKSIELQLATLPFVYTEPMLDIYFVILKNDPKYDNRVINGILNSRQVKMRQSEPLLK